jgi:ATP-dependent Lhr-like helicase
VRQIQSSASLLYDVFSRYDPENLLLAQARREVVEQQFERDRLLAGLTRLREEPIEVVVTRRPSPLAVPLVVERLAVDSSTSESLDARIERLRAEWEREG